MEVMMEDGKPVIKIEYEDGLDGLLLASKLYQDLNAVALVNFQNEKVYDWVPYNPDTETLGDFLARV